MKHKQVTRSQYLQGFQDLADVYYLLSKNKSLLRRPRTIECTPLQERTKPLRPAATHPCPCRSWKERRVGRAWADVCEYTYLLFTTNSSLILVTSCPPPLHLPRRRLLIGSLQSDIRGCKDKESRTQHGETRVLPYSQLQSRQRMPMRRNICVR